MYKRKFFFIVFEGIEGTGKSFQIEKLYKNLKKKNLSVLKTREPGGSKSAETIRNLIFSKTSSTFHKKTDYYLMLASRNEHLINTLLPAKKKKLIVISDRFTDSTYAYQVSGNNIDSKVNLVNKNYILNSFRPDLTIVLKSSLKMINSRLKKRKQLNKFDKLKNSFFIKVQNVFIKLAKNDKKKYFLIDTSVNNNSAEKKILEVISKKLKI